MDLYELNPQRSSQILIKLLPAILGCPLSFLPPDWQPHFLVNERCWGWYISGLISYIYVSFFVWYVVPEFSNVRCFHSSRKYNFLTASGCFLAITPPKVSNSFEIWTSNEVQGILRLFTKSWKFQEMKTKNWFSFPEVFWLCLLLRPMSYAVICLANERSHKDT